MKIRLIIGQRICRYDGEYAPEVLDCWDEGALEENHDGFSEVLAKYERDPSFGAVRLLDIIVADEAVDAIFEIPVAEGTIA